MVGGAGALVPSGAIFEALRLPLGSESTLGLAGPNGTPEIADTCYDHKPGDTDRYDVFFKPRAKPEPADATAASRLPR